MNTLKIGPTKEVEGKGKETPAGRLGSRGVEESRGSQGRRSFMLEPDVDQTTSTTLLTQLKVSTPENPDGLQYLKSYANQSGPLFRSSLALHLGYLLLKKTPVAEEEDKILATLWDLANDNDSKVRYAVVYALHKLCVEREEMGTTTVFLNILKQQLEDEDSKVWLGAVQVVNEIKFEDEFLKETENSFWSILRINLQAINVGQEFLKETKNPFGHISRINIPKLPAEATSPETQQALADNLLLTFEKWESLLKNAMLLKNPFVGVVLKVMFQHQNPVVWGKVHELLFKILGSNSWAGQNDTIVVFLEEILKQKKQSYLQQRAISLLGEFIIEKFPGVQQLAWNKLKKLIPRKISAEEGKQQKALHARVIAVLKKIVDARPKLETYSDAASALLSNLEKKQKLDPDIKEILRS